METKPERQERIAYVQGPQVSGNKTQVEELGLVTVKEAEHPPPKNAFKHKK